MTTNRCTKRAAGQALPTDSLDGEFTRRVAARFEEATTHVVAAARAMVAKDARMSAAEALILLGAAAKYAALDATPVSPVMAAEKRAAESDNESATASDCAADLCRTCGESHDDCDPRLHDGSLPVCGQCGDAICTGCCTVGLFPETSNADVVLLCATCAPDRCDAE